MSECEEVSIKGYKNMKCWAKKKWQNKNQSVKSLIVVRRALLQVCRC